MRRRYKIEIDLNKLFSLLRVDAIVVFGNSLDINPRILESMPELAIFKAGKGVYIPKETLDYSAFRLRDFVAFKPRKHMGLVIMRKGVAHPRVDKNHIKRMSDFGFALRGQTEVASPFLGDWKEGKIVWR